ncbi:MAG: Flp pilus assembly complex ATPase component TadA [Desulfovibrio sp.]|jgi:type II secretory ATPase GspE/PulE/Tfp pilus assembly ATPase PilB-like protein|nr:Flp pilus assembly complex ATPase component TadA [Desulfovibrio sp.]
MTAFYNGASDELRRNIFLEDGILYVSEAWKSEPEYLSFFSLSRKRGVLEAKSLPPDDFLKRYNKASMELGNTQQSELQTYAAKLLKTAYEQNASDIHIADYGTYGVIHFRCLGMLRSYAQLPGSRVKQLIAVIYGTMAQQASTASHTPSVRQDARIARREFLPEKVHSVRVHTEPLECSQAEGGVGCLMLLRLLYDRTEAAGDLRSRLIGLGYSDPDVGKFRFLTERSGLIIISGPTGHGKSTLLKHVMEAQAEEAPEKSYQSIEDPPEYPLANVKQIMVTTGNIASDPAARGRNYIDSIAGAMRSDPDVLMIGEIRFPEAAVAAIDAALTGHAVWATLHANNGLGIIPRMKSLLNGASYAEPLEYLCDHNVLAGLVYQRLVPVLCDQCKVRLQNASEAWRREVLPAHTFERVKKAVTNPEEVHVRGPGCAACGQVGFTGQTVAAEVIVTDQALLGYIRAGKMPEAYEYWRAVMGGRTYVQDAIRKMESGILDPYMTELRLGVPLNFSHADVSGKGSL